MPDVIKLLGPTGNKKIITALSGGGGVGGEGFDQDHRQEHDLLAWETEGSIPQELEVLVYPLFRDVAGLTTDPFTMLPTFDCVTLDYRWSMGAGNIANAIGHSTMARVQSAYVQQAQAYLPDHGIKFRVACRSFRLRLLIGNGPIAFQAVASASPVIGGEGTPVFPQVNRLGKPRLLIPYGAREFRVFPMLKTGVFYPGLTVWFSHPFDALTPAIAIPASECTEWTLIPGQYAYVEGTHATDDSQVFSTIEFR